MASELRVNTSSNRVGLGTITYTDSGPIVSGIVTANSFSGDIIGNITGAVTATTGSFSGDVSISEKIIHTGDTNTFMKFGTDTITFETAGDERIRIDSVGRILAGTSTYKSNLNSSADAGGQIVQFVGKADNTNHCVGIFAYSGTSNPTARGAKLQLNRARSTDGTTNTAVADNDLIGTVEFKGNDATSFTPAAKIDCFVDGSPGTDDMPGRLVFSTSADGSGVPTERLRIDSNGRLLLGTTAGRSAGGVTAQLQVEGTSYNTSSLNLIINQNSADPAYISLSKSRGTSDGSSTVVQNGDYLGLIQWCGADGTDINSRAAEITAQVDGSPGSNDLPGRLIFGTTADGAATPSERLRITSTGSIHVGGTTTATGTFTVKNINDNSHNVLECLNDNGNVVSGFSQASDGDGSFFAKLNDGTLTHSFRSDNISYINNTQLFSIGATANYGTIGTAAAFQIQGTNTGSNTSMNIVNAATSNASSTCDINAWQDYRLSTRIISGRENASNWTSSASAAASFLAFYTNNAGTVAERLRIDSAGDLKSTGRIAGGGGAFSDATAGHDDLVLKTSGSTGMTIVSGTTSNGTIAFADGTSGNAYYRGFLQYNHNTDLMSIGVGGGTMMEWTNENVNIKDGNLIIGTAGHGIDFSAQTASSATGATTGSEVLAHYEEGSWTPVFYTYNGSAWVTGSFTTNPTSTDARYTRIGRYVLITCRISGFQTNNSGVAYAMFAGIPFTAVNYQGSGSLAYTNSAFTTEPTAIQISGNQVEFYVGPNWAAWSNNSGGHIGLSASYMI